MLGKQDVECDDLGAAGRKLLGQPREVITRPRPGADQLDAFIVDQNDANVRSRQVARAQRLPTVEYAAPHALAEAQSEKDGKQRHGQPRHDDATARPLRSNLDFEPVIGAQDFERGASRVRAS